MIHDSPPTDVSSLHVAAHISVHVCLISAPTETDGTHPKDNGTATHPKDNGTANYE